MARQESRWPVDNVQVKVLQPQVSQAGPAGSFHPVSSVLGAPQLTGNEDIGPVHVLSFSDDLIEHHANFFLISIDKGAVDMPKPILDRVPDGLSHVSLVPMVPGTQAKHGHAEPIVERHSLV